MQRNSARYMRPMVRCGPMRVSRLLLVVACACGGAAKTGGGGGTTPAKQTTVDPGVWKNQMSVYTDGGKRVVAVVLPDPEREDDPDLKMALFYGDANQLEAQNTVR